MSRRLKNYWQSPRDALPARRGRSPGVKSEELEGRILYSADVPRASSYVALVDEQKNRQEGDSNHRQATPMASADQSGFLLAVDSRVLGEPGVDQESVARELTRYGVPFEQLDLESDPIADIGMLLSDRAGTHQLHKLARSSEAGVELGRHDLDTDYVLNNAGSIAEWREGLEEGARISLHAVDVHQFEQIHHVTQLLSSVPRVSDTSQNGIDLGSFAELVEPGNPVDPRIEFVDGEKPVEANGLSPVVTAFAQMELEQRQEPESISVAKNQAVITVTTTNDTVNGDTSSIANLIATQGGDGISLREAIIAANDPASGTGPHTIQFNFTGSGPHTITLGSELPELIRPVIIDGSTEPDYSGAPVVVLDLSSLGTVDGLRLGAGSGGSTVRGLSIIGAGDTAVYITNGSDGNTIAGNYLGVDASGLAAVTGGSALVYIESENNVVGGSTAADRNVIAGGANGVVINSGSSNTVSGNYIGTDATGNTTLGIVFDGIRLENNSGGNTIGGATRAEGNLIGGVSHNGVQVSGYTASRNIIQNNLVGATADGTSTLPVGNDGIQANSQADLIWILDNHIAATAGAGIYLDDVFSGVIQGNMVGTNADGTQNWGTEFTGIRLDNGSSFNLIGGTGAGAGEGNTIANSGTSNSTSDGIGIGGATSDNDSFRGNSIYNSADIGIDLNSDGPSANDGGDTDTNANDGQNYAQLISAEIDAIGNFNYQVSTSQLVAGTYTLDFYASTDLEDGNVEGRRYLGSVTGRPGNTSLVGGSLSGVSLQPGEYVTLVTTTENGGLGEHSSEFSNAVVATSEIPYGLSAVTSTGDGVALNHEGGNDAYFQADDGDAIIGGRSELTFEIQFSTTNTTSDLTLWSYDTANGAADGLSFDNLTIRPPKELTLALDRLFAEQQSSAQSLELKVTGAVMGSVSLCAGFIIWVLRAGSLMGSFLASRPLWSTIDPLPIFWADDEDDSREIDS